MGQCIFKNGPSKICGRQLLKNLKWYCLDIVCLSTPYQGYITSNFLKALFHKFQLYHFWILCLIYNDGVFEPERMISNDSKNVHFIGHCWSVQPLGFHLTPCSAIYTLCFAMRANGASGGKWKIVGQKYQQSLPRA